MMCDTNAIARMDNTITIAKCALVIAVCASLAALVAMIGSDKIPGLLMSESHAITITKSILPSSGMSVQ